jgi:hypothetical protein
MLGAVAGRVLLIVNSESGTGCAQGLPAALAQELRRSDATPGDLELAVVRDHPTARELAAEFAADSQCAGAVIAAGGGGTLRAAVEGVFDACAADRVVMGALRMGSGNVLARRLGIAREPLAGIRQLGTALASGSTQCRPVLRCELGTRDGRVDVRHAVVMLGLGQWGRCAGDLARWHRRAGSARAALARVGGIERVNHLEYAVAAGARLLESAVRPGACELVDVTRAGATERFRLLAGVALTTPIAGLPTKPGVVLVPRGGRPRRSELPSPDPLRIALLDRGSVEVFLDEDPEVAHGSISIELARTILFLEAKS